LKIAVYTIALNESAHAERWASSAADADYRIVADTGSIDDTVERLTKAGVTVHRIAIQPWRFDDARNAAMALIPADVDVCCSMDMDEYLSPGWRPKLEAAWTAETTALFCRKAPRARVGDAVPLNMFPVKNFHARFGYRFRRPVHEHLSFAGVSEVTRDCAEIVINHVQDDTKTTRRHYLPLMEAALKEDPGDGQIAFWLAREYMWANEPARACEFFERYLATPSSTWAEERSEAMRFLARLQPERRMPWLDKARIEAPHRREIWLDLAEEFHGHSDWLNLFWACTNGIEKSRRTGSYLDDPHCWGFRLFDLGAISAWHLNAMDRAVEWGRNALELDPCNQRLKNNLDFFVRREAEVRGGGSPAQTFLHASYIRRIEVNQFICSQTNSIVASGPFAGMKILNQRSWGDGDVAPKLLGTYEIELREALLRFQRRSYGAIVNVACAEGYYAVGLARLNPSWRVYAFDKDPKAQQLCHEAAKINGVADRVIIDGFCSAEVLSSLTRKHGTLLCVIDCGGYELELLTSVFLDQYGRTSDFIVECHDRVAPGTTSELQKRFKYSHRVTLVKPSARDPNNFDFLSQFNDMERWLAVSEMRGYLMNWLVCDTVENALG
jgi:hypothetical protein